jgi:putative cell wall-binding protein
MIATGTGFADALAAGPASAQLAAPLLLVAPDALPQVVAEELTRLAPCTVTVVGGRNAVSDEVAEAAAEAASRGRARLLTC